MEDHPSVLGFRCKTNEEKKRSKNNHARLPLDASDHKLPLLSCVSSSFMRAIGINEKATP
jgi:hypothetical protein